jgi:NitT/TauT family transport system permease protein
VTSTASIAKVAARLAAVGGAVALWWLCAAVVWANNPVISQIGPLDAVPALVDHIANGRGVDDAFTSLGRLLSGLTIATAVGVPLGVVLGLRPGIELAASPVINFLRMISPLAWAPIVIVALGVGSGPVVFLVAVTAVWPVALGTASGVRQVSPSWYAVARSLGANRREQLFLVTAPAVRATVLTAVRLALGVAWIVLVPAEMLGVDSGLGYAVLNARDQLDYPMLGATVLFIGTIGFVLDTVFRRLLPST